MKSRIIFAFLLGVGISFNSFGFTLAGRTISIGLITASLYMLSILKDFGNIAKLSTSYGKYVYLPLVYFAIVFLNKIIFPVNYQFAPVMFLSSYFMDWILMIFVLCNSITDDKCAQYIMDGVMIGASIVALCFFLGIGVSYDVLLDGARFSIFGSNSNVTGMLQSLAYIITFNHLLYSKNKPVLIAFLLLQLALILATASRTAFLIVVISTILFVITYDAISKTNKFLLIVLFSGLFALGILYLINNDATIVVRLLNSSDNGSMSGRTDIWEALIPQISEHFWFGVGESGYNNIAYRTWGHYGSPHNEIIFILLTSGFIGFMAMAIFWTKSVIGGFRAFRKSNNIFYLLICLPTVFAIFAQQMLYEKFAWLSFAFMVIYGKKLTSKIIREK